MIRTLGGMGSNKERVFLSNPYSTDADQAIFEAVVAKYEGKIVRDMYVLKVLRILDYGPWIVSTSDNDGNVYSDVLFECEVFQPEIGDIVIGAVCESAGRALEIPKLTKDKMSICVKLNNNLEQLILEQKVTLRIRSINWDPGSSTIDVSGTLIHARVYPAVVYEIKGEEVLEYKDLIKSYNQTTESLLKEIKGLEEFVERAYPFSTKATFNLPTKPFDDIFKDCLEGKIKGRAKLIDCCFLDRVDGLVYVGEHKPKVRETLTCIKSLYEGRIKALRNIVEMSVEYADWSKDIAEYYSTSKKNNDNFISTIKNGLTSLK